MGVWAAAQTFQTSSLDFKISIAINGTLSPVNDQFGIPESIFKGTIDHFSERNRLKFNRRMHRSKEDNHRFNNTLSTRGLEDQLQELKAIFTLAKDSEINFPFNKAIVGSADLIFPTKNQIQFWKDRSEIKELELAHFPFFQYKTWSEIVDL